MFASFRALLASPVTGAKPVKMSRVEADLHALLDRMRRRLYPETIPALASLWLKALSVSGYSLQEWKNLNHLLSCFLRTELQDHTYREVIVDIQKWIQGTAISGGGIPTPEPRGPEPVSTRLQPKGVAAYTVRLLNEWLPMEVARLLINATPESMAPQEAGIPLWAVTSALERLLIRNYLSRATLEMLLQPQLLSPEYVYPADLEMLQDCVLALLGRTQAPTQTVLPATLLCVAPDSHLPADYREALPRASVASGPRGEEIHVPVEAARALEILRNETVRIGSIIVTMDGRAWESESLESGEHHFVVYRPVGLLRINYARDHARLRTPWPENLLRWSGGGYSPKTFRVFGREWRISEWVVDAERTWVDLEFLRVLPIAGIPSAAATRLRPASVDIAWAALEGALTNSLMHRSLEPIEQLRHSDLIPLGRAIVRLTESVTASRSQSHEAVERQLGSLRYLESSILSTYGRVPWRILPGSLRKVLLNLRLDPVLVDGLNEVIEGLPDVVQSRARQVASSEKAPGSRTPHAA